jgi:hypothetical protein
LATLVGTVFDCVDNGLTACYVLVYEGENFGLDVRPGSSTVFSYGYVVGAEENGGYAVDVYKLGRERGRVGRRERRAWGKIFEGGRRDGLGEDALVGVEFKSLVRLAGKGWGLVEGRTSALGVVSVWMNIVRRPRFAGDLSMGEPHRRACGLCWRGEGVMGDAFWCKHRVAARGAFVVVDPIARDKERREHRGTVMEAIAR